MASLKQLYLKILDLGIPDSFSDIERLKSRFNNQMILFTLILIFSASIPLAFIGEYRVIYGVSFYFLGQAISLLFAALNKPKTSRNFNVFSDFLVLIFATYIAAIEVNSYVFVFPLMSMVYFLVSNTKLRALYIVLSFVSIVIIVWHQASRGIIVLTSADYLNVYVTMVSLALHVNILVSFLKENNVYLSAINEKQESLDNAQYLAKLGTWVCDLVENRTDTSKQLRKMLQLDDTYLKVDNFLKTIFPPKEYEYVHNLKNNLTDNTFDLIFSTIQNDEKVWYRAIGEVLINQKEVPYRLIGTLQNITERIESEEKINSLLSKLRHQNDVLSRQADDLKRSNEELEQFAYVASHDLQEPLRMVGNFAQLLEEEMEDKIDEEERTYVNYIVDGVTRMGNLIDDLLQYSRVGRTKMNLVSINLKDVIDKKLFDLSLKIKESNAQIMVKGLPENITCEPNLISIVFYNLINNGLKFNDKPQPRIIIDYEELDDNYLFKISDNGIGIDKNNHHKIFEIFKRLHRKEEYKGTGIGLALVKRILLKHGGNIWLKSELNEGTTFYFTIPKV